MAHMHNKPSRFAKTIAGQMLEQLSKAALIDIVIERLYLEKGTDKDELTANEVIDMIRGDLEARGDKLPKAPGPRKERPQSTTSFEPQHIEAKLRHIRSLLDYMKPEELEVTMADKRSFYEKQGVLVTEGRVI